MHAIIIGAGPAGLAAALALRQQSTPSSPIRVTLLELRPNVQTLGGAVNLTPLAMRYLDSLGIGPRLRPLGIKVSYIDIISSRTGTSLGKLWHFQDVAGVAPAVGKSAIETPVGIAILSIQGFIFFVTLLLAVPNSRGRGRANVAGAPDSVSGFDEEENA